VKRSIAPLIDGSPHASTKTHEQQVRHPGREELAAAVVLRRFGHRLVAGQRIGLAGFHSLSTATITMMHGERAQDVGELGAHVVGHVELHAANDTPQAMIAGSTSKARLAPTITTSK
jgi:hypothetical protein